MYQRVQRAVARMNSNKKVAARMISDRADVMRRRVYGSNDSRSDAVD
jgi:hypothetical protein